MESDAQLVSSEFPIGVRVMQFYMKLLFQLRELFVKDSILLD